MNEEVAKITEELRKVDSECRSQLKSKAEEANKLSESIKIIETTIAEI